MGGCRQCETSVEEVLEEGVLYLATPLGHTIGTVRRLLKDMSLKSRSLGGDVLCVELERESLVEFSRAIRKKLGTAELRDTRVMLKARGEEFTGLDLAKVEDLGKFTASVEAVWLREMIRDDRLVTHFQPIVRIEDGGVFAHECLLRGVDLDSSLIAPGRMFDTARDSGMLFELDRVARIKSIREASRYNLDSYIFINFNPTSIYDPVYCLKSTMRAIEDSGLEYSRIVFEVTESDEVRDTEHLFNTLSFYRNAGFNIALDDLGAGYNSLNLLVRLRPDFVKLDMYLTRGVEKDPYKAAVARRILDLAGDLGVRTVAEGIESEEQWRWFRRAGANFAQGFYFAKPASPPPLPAPIELRATRSA